MKYGETSCQEIFKVSVLYNIQKWLWSSSWLTILDRISTHFMQPCCDIILGIGKDIKYEELRAIASGVDKVYTANTQSDVLRVQAEIQRKLKFGL